MKDKLIACGLIFLGCIQMIGDLTHLSVLKAIGQASNASPLPKVFTSQHGYETFSKRFYFKVQDKQGKTQQVEITPSNYQYLKGPYNRRNMYGATISYGPVLVRFSRTKPMFESVAAYGLCQSGQTILEEMGIDYDKTKSITLLLQPRHDKDEDNEWVQEFTFSCQEKSDA
jgi:hypothetical protein